MTPYLTLDFIVRSGLGLLVLLCIYRLFLENQPMHRLKRTYLLGTLVVSLMAPLITVEVPVGAARLVASELPLVNMISSQPINSQDIRLPVRPELATNNVLESGNYWLWVYTTGTLLMLGRFGRNLYRLRRQVRTNPTESFRGATLVRLPGEAIGAGLPYTFLHYLFVPDMAYQRGEIEGELFTHELTHIRQRHSLDVLLVELILCFGWFNPLLFWLKRAIQLNHEFLADQTVNQLCQNVPGYQHLLLSKLTPSTPRLSLTSTLTFQTTKQRLMMMTKHASPLRTWLTGIGSALVLGTLTVLLSTKAVAQQTPAAPATKKEIPQSTLTDEQLFNKNMSAADIDRLFGDAPVSEAVKPGIKKPVKRQFEELTPAEKTRVAYLPPSPRNTPTEAQWADFKSTKKYGIWVDEKRRRDNPMSKYNRADIVHFWYSFVHKNARQPEGYSYQLELYTEAGYQKMLRESKENPLLILVSRERFDKRRKNIAER